MKKFKFYIHILFYIIIVPSIMYPLSDGEIRRNSTYSPTSVYYELPKAENKLMNHPFRSTLLYGDHYNHLHANHYAKDELVVFSASKLKSYFGHYHYSEKDILECNILYMSDEFVRLAKKCLGYQYAVKNLYCTLKDMNFFARLDGIVHGFYCSGLFKRVERLYEEIREIKKYINTQ